VRGTGEDLPFLAEAFDVVLAFWTLNHAADPQRLLSEVARVLAPGGVFLAVLEDMEPRWRDFARPAFRRRGARDLVRSMARKARAHLPGREWPVQNDHRRIRESDLQRWTALGFDSSWRAWTGGYLTYQYTRRVRV
jgi:ubiquinone/menaquinone biosynthesis C-methylase UbiE